MVDGSGHVLVWEFIRKRTAENIYKIISKAIDKLRYFPEIIVSDDFSTYKKVAKMLNRDIIHIRHIHKGLRYHIIIDAIKHEKDKIVIRHIATTNDIFKGENVFMTRESNTIEKKRGKGKKGRKREPENKIRSRTRQTENESKKTKRGGKNYFKKGVPYLYRYRVGANTVSPVWNDNDYTVEILGIVSKYFNRKSITSNIVEQQFSLLKRLVNFGVRRNKKEWELTLYLYYSIREFPEVVREIINDSRLCSRIVRRSKSLILRLLRYCEEFESETIYQRIPLS